MPDRQFPGGDMLHALSMLSIQLAFLRHADRVKIGCMTGGLGALCSSNHDHVWKSASHYAFMDMINYAKGTSMRTDVQSETYDIPGYAIDDTSQYYDKEGLTFVDSASAWDEENETLTIFVINRNDETEYPIRVDVRGFEEYTFDKHIELCSDDLDAKNSFEEPERIMPALKSGGTFEDGIYAGHVRPLSWNVLRFKKK